MDVTSPFLAGDLKPYR